MARRGRNKNIGWFASRGNNVNGKFLELIDNLLCM